MSLLDFLNWIVLPQNSHSNDKSRKEDFEYLTTDLFHIIAEINKAKQSNDYKMLDAILRNNDDFISIKYDEVSFNLNYAQLSQQRNHKYICTVLSDYYCQKSNPSSVKELSILAILTDDILTERYQHECLSEDNLNLSYLLIGDKKYTEIFISRFSEFYEKLKNQRMKLSDGEIGFFGILALKQNKDLLNEVIKYAPKDFEEEISKIIDSRYGSVEIASMMGNIEFIEQVLKRVQDSEVITTILRGAISQEQLEIVRLISNSYMNGDEKIKQLYIKAFISDNVIGQINNQLFRSLSERSRKEIYTQILITLLNADSWQAIEKILVNAENRFINKNHEPLHYTLLIILEYARNQANMVAKLFNRYNSLYDENIKKMYQGFLTQDHSFVVENSIKDLQISKNPFVNNSQDNVKPINHQLIDSVNNSNKVQNQSRIEESSANQQFITDNTIKSLQNAIISEKTLDQKFTEDKNSKNLSPITTVPVVIKELSSARQNNTQNKRERLETKLLNKENIFTVMSTVSFTLAAYFAGATNLTPSYVAVAALGGSAIIGALIGYGITKLCEKVGKERRQNIEFTNVLVSNSPEKSLRY